jgi:hypothetical protein
MAIAAQVICMPSERVPNTWFASSPNRMATRDQRGKLGERQGAAKRYQSAYAPEEVDLPLCRGDSRKLAGRKENARADHVTHDDGQHGGQAQFSFQRHYCY